MPPTLAESRGIALSFSITTNGTLLTQADAEFFEAHGFAVTVSLDGPRELHDQAAAVQKRRRQLRSHHAQSCSRCWRSNAACRSRRASP